MILEKSRKFGTLFGNPPVKGAKYSQDGKFFNAKGELIGATPELPPAASTVPTGMPGTEPAAPVKAPAVKAAPVKAKPKGKVAKPTKGELIEGKPMPGISLEEQLMASASE